MMGCLADAADRRRIPWRTIVGGLALQFAFAFLTLGTVAGRVVRLAGQSLYRAFGLRRRRKPVRVRHSASRRQLDRRLLASFAFGVLPSIVFFSSLVSVLYHFNIMQRVVSLAARLMQKTLNLSGAESLSVAANIFLGQVEAPLVGAPYLNSMTRSELMAVMMAG